MNETTWIISPNWLVWTLLAICAASLFNIAVCAIVSLNRNKDKVTTENCVCDKKQPKKYKLFSFLSLSLSVAAIIFTIVGDSNSTTSSFLVSVLGILTTALIGWQVYVLIDLRQTKKDLDNIINDRFDNYSFHVMAMAYIGNAQLYRHSHHLLNSIDYLTGHFYNKSDIIKERLSYLGIALDNANKCNVKQSVSLIYNELEILQRNLSEALTALRKINTEIIDQIINGLTEDNSKVDEAKRLKLINDYKDLKKKIQQQ